MKLSNFLGGCFGVVGFVVSILAGLHADNAFGSIILKSLLAMAACYTVGYMAGWVSQVISVEHADQIAKKVATQDAQQHAKQEEERVRKEADAQVAAI